MVCQATGDTQALSTVCCIFNVGQQKNSGLYCRLVRLYNVKLNILQYIFCFRLFLNSSIFCYVTIYDGVAQLMTPNQQVLFQLDFLFIYVFLVFIRCFSMLSSTMWHPPHSQLTKILGYHFVDSEPITTTAPSLGRVQLLLKMGNMFRKYTCHCT